MIDRPILDGDGWIDLVFFFFFSRFQEDWFFHDVAAPAAVGNTDDRDGAAGRDALKDDRGGADGDRRRDGLWRDEEAQNVGNLAIGRFFRLSTGNQDGSGGQYGARQEDD